MELTDEQRNAVTTEARECVVMAGAGSGKTRVIIARIRHLLGQGVSPSEIMVLTFTRRAAREMRDRLVQSITEEGGDADSALRGLLMGTFHSIALHILRSSGHVIGYTTGTITMLDPDDADLLLMDCSRDMGLLQTDMNGADHWGHGLSWKALRKARERLYQTGAEPGNRHVASVLGHYRAVMFDMNAVDFGILLLRCHELLDIPEVLAGWQAKIRHVLLDEAQDCDTIQYRLHRCFVPPATMFMVGDTRQCIYTWRGARPDLMMACAPETWGPDRIHHLTTCFRSGIEIVQCANNLIAHNDDPLVVPMISAHDWSGSVSLQMGRSHDVADLVKRTHDGRPIVGIDADSKPFPWNEIAVLSRTHQPLQALGRCLAAMEIPFQHVGRGFEVCRTDPFRQIHACLRLAVNDRDELAFRRVIAIYDQNCRAVYTRIRAAARKLGIPSVQFLRSERDSNSAEVRELIEAVTNAALTQTIGELMTMLKNHLPDYGFASENAEWFWINHCCELSVPEALMWYGLSDSQDDIRDGDHVTLSTIHAAKGLEWPVVIVLDLNEGRLPSSQSIKDPMLVFDERRVCYVAATRAKERLIFHWRSRSEQPANRFQPRSRFLDEINLPATAPTAAEPT